MWYLGGVDPAATIAFFFEVTNTNATPLPPHKRRYIQFLTSYQAASGRFRLRVTTVCGLWHSDPADHSPIAQSFDQARLTHITNIRSLNSISAPKNHFLANNTIFSLVCRKRPQF